MGELAEAVERLALESRFSGVVRVDGDDHVALAAAYGMADRRWGIPNTVDTRFALASGMKGLTALVVVSLIQDGVLELGTVVRTILGRDLPLIDDRVTVEHLLAHRSGIGDYLDEDEEHEITEYLMPVPVHELDTTESYLVALDGHPSKFAPGERFSYCNGGFVVLALVAERVSGVSLPELVRTKVCSLAGMHDTELLRSDELPPNTAVGYVDDAARTNVFHLPVRGSGDGGIYSTAADIRALWRALFDGRIVPPAWVTEIVRPRCDAPEHAKRYGLGFWLHPSSDVVLLEGYDAGVSFRSAHDPRSHVTHTVIANTSDGAWPVSRLLAEHLST